MSVLKKIEKTKELLQEDRSYSPICASINYLRELTGQKITIRETNSILDIMAAVTDHTKADIMRGLQERYINIKAVNIVTESIKAEEKRTKDRLDEERLQLVLAYHDECLNTPKKGTVADINYPEVEVDSEGFPLDWDGLTDEQWKYFKDKQRYHNYEPYSLPKNWKAEVNKDGTRTLIYSPEKEEPFQDTLPEGYNEISDIDEEAKGTMAVFAYDENIRYRNL